MDDKEYAEYLKEKNKNVDIFPKTKRTSDD